MNALAANRRRLVVPRRPAATDQAGVDENSDLPVDGTLRAGRSPALEKLLTKWYRNRRGKGVVPVADFMVNKLGDILENCFIIEPQQRNGPLVFARVGTIPPADGGPSDVARDAAMLLEWITELSRRAIHYGGPIVRYDFFPCEEEGAEYGCAVMPLADDQGATRAVIGIIEAIIPRHRQASPHRQAAV